MMSREAMNINLSPRKTLSTPLEFPQGSGGTSDYTQLSNKPKINGVELNGNLSAEDLGIPAVGIPSGGTAGQFLVKSSSTDYDVEWISLSTWSGGSY